MIGERGGGKKADLSSRSELVQSIALLSLPRAASSYDLFRAPFDQASRKEATWMLNYRLNSIRGSLARYSRKRSAAARWNSPNKLQSTFTGIEAQGFGVG
jgi:hypothetical protein